MNYVEKFMAQVNPVTHGAYNPYPKQYLT
jgi:hypothetical protein